MRTHLSRFFQSIDFMTYFLSKYRRQTVAGAFCLLCIAILEMFPPLLLMGVVDRLVEGHSEIGTLATLGAAYFGVLLLQGACRYGWRVNLIRTSMLSGRDIRNTYASHLFYLPRSFFEKRKIGDLMSLATNDTLAIRKAIGSGFIVLVDSFFYFLSLPIAMFILSPKLTLVTLLPLPLIPVIVVILLPRIHKRFTRVQEAFGKISAFSQEAITGIRLIKAFAREDTQVERFRKQGAEFMEKGLKFEKLQSLFGPSLDFAMTLALVLLLYVGGGMAIEGAISVGTLVAFQRYLVKLAGPMEGVGWAINYLQQAVVSAERMQEILSIPREPISPALAPYPKRSGKIEVRNLSYQYPGSSNWALKDVSFVIEPGQKLALMGPVGSGKTTLLMLLPRTLRAPDKTLFIDGKDINDWDLAELREAIGTVSQDPFLFSRSVIENISFNENALREPLEMDRLFEKARQAQIHQEILKLEKGYASLLGERGVNLSGGQRQRLTLLRAIAKPSPILLLDDCLSAIDTQTEYEILKSLRDAVGTKSVIASTHRVSIASKLDTVLILKDGQVTEIGPHSSLLQNPNSLYAKFVKEQTLRKTLYESPETSPTALG